MTKLYTGKLAWMNPTKYIDRFHEAMTLLCRAEPPREMVEAWLDRSKDDHRLQEFAVEHAPDWAQGIALIDAAYVLADQPTEGIDHEMRDEPAADTETDDPLVEVTENGEGQENVCPTSGAEPGQMCSDAQGQEHGRKVHSKRQDQAPFGYVSQQHGNWLFVPGYEGDPSDTDPGGYTWQAVEQAPKKWPGPFYDHATILTLCRDQAYHVADHVVRLQKHVTRLKACDEVADGPLPNEPKPCLACDPSVGFKCDGHAE